MTASDSEAPKKKSALFDVFRCSDVDFSKKIEKKQVRRHGRPFYRSDRVQSLSSKKKTLQWTQASASGEVPIKVALQTAPCSVKHSRATLFFHARARAHVPSKKKYLLATVLQHGTVRSVRFGLVRFSSKSEESTESIPRLRKAVLSVLQAGSRVR